MEKKDKLTEQDKIEVDNLMEEIIEILEQRRYHENNFRNHHNDV